MHQPVFLVALAWLAVLAGTLVVMLVRSRAMASRILALDTLTMLLVAALVLLATAERSSAYLDAAMALALLSFVGTLVAARYHAHRSIFS